MAYVAVSESYNGTVYEEIFQNKPVKQKSFGGYYRRNYVYWHDKTEYDRQRGYSTDANDGSIRLPIGSIKKLIGRELTPNDEPVKI